MNTLKHAVLALLSLLLLSLPLAGLTAASGTELTPSIQAAFDLTAAVADSSSRSKLKSQYSELSALSAQYDSREEQIRKLHEDNAQSLIAVKEQIKNIDQATVTRLSAVVVSTKGRYQPLFDQYSALNTRISLLRGLKDKSLNSILRAQSDAMKILVQMARQDIRDQEAQLKAAKDIRTKKIAAVRKTLAGIESPQTSIKTQKSVAVSLNKRLTADWSDFKSAIRKKNPALTGGSLTSLLSGHRQIAASKQKIIELEQKVAAVIAAASRQITS
ncbi:hypothetical protein A3842_17270 [Paenibacillus sp. P3E]|uniref:hypothetical protein n=1 Tax=Paenibacillus sp. P3E TaxID=1349435 RepID=UPI00093EBDAE|nr:hypothetical protein [Paenibacillus sp. P3E]OKP76766.1 hypothetical protein A3842_17270 [Paenibacillus sp. P3E]